jgi:hypothetical protein
MDENEKLLNLIFNLTKNRSTNMKHSLVFILLLLISVLSFKETNAQLWKKIKDKAENIVNNAKSKIDSSLAKESKGNDSEVIAVDNYASPGACFNKKDLPYFSISQDFSDHIKGTGRIPDCIKSIPKLNSEKKEIYAFSETYDDKNHLTEPYDYLYACSLGHCDLDILKVSALFFKNFELAFPGGINDIAVAGEKNIKELRLNHKYKFLGNSNVQSGYNPFIYLGECKQLSNHFAKLNPVNPAGDLTGALTIGVFKDKCDDIYLFVQAKGARNRPKGNNNYEITLSGNFMVWKGMAERMEAALTKHCFEIEGNKTEGNVHYIGERFNGGIVFSLNETKKHGLIVTAKDLTGQNGAPNWNEANNLANNYFGPDNMKGWRLPFLKELGLLCRMKEQIGGLTGNTYWSGTRATLGGGMASVNAYSCGDSGAGTPENIPGLSVRAVKEF